MCLAKAYVDEEEGSVLEDITSLRVEGTKLRLRNLFGETKELEASVKEIDFRQSRIVLQSRGGKG
ncbi:MAG: CooT family nickel-binding protein [Chloroflexota bacterium]